MDQTQLNRDAEGGEFETCEITLLQQVHAPAILGYTRKGTYKAEPMTHAPNDPDFWPEGAGYRCEVDGRVLWLKGYGATPPKAVRFRRSN